MSASKKKVLTHLDNKGRAKMVEVTAKQDSHREAVARGVVELSEDVLRLIKQGKLQKGDPLEVARLAGIMAAKRTHELIPLCHPLLLTKIDVQIALTDAGAEMESSVVCVGKTGVEMEALTAVSVAALTIYDMCKSVDKSIKIGNICLVKKSGGKSGPYLNPAAIK
ncbi:MAG: cyclic pyranopterin monophosphate synthase MoaC [bacterium]